MRKTKYILGSIKTTQSYFLGDTSEEKVSKSLMEETVKKFGRIDVLTNNAELADKASARNINEISNTATNSSYEQVSPYFTLEEYEWNGEKHLQLKVCDFRLSEQDNHGNSN